MGNKNFFSGLEYFTMLAILALGSNAYGVTIHERICDISGKNVAYGAVYNALKSLAQKGFIKSRKGEATPERGGRAKTYYKIEALGQHALSEFENSVQVLKSLQPAY